MHHIFDAITLGVLKCKETFVLVFDVTCTCVFFSFTAGFLYYGVVLMTTQVFQQMHAEGSSCNRGTDVNSFFKGGGGARWTTVCYTFVASLTQQTLASQADTGFIRVMENLESL